MHARKRLFVVYDDLLHEHSLMKARGLHLVSARARWHEIITIVKMAISFSLSLLITITLTIAGSLRVEAHRLCQPASRTRDGEYFEKRSDPVFRATVGGKRERHNPYLRQTRNSTTRDACPNISSFISFHTSVSDRNRSEQGGFLSLTTTGMIDC